MGERGGGEGGAKGRKQANMCTNFKQNEIRAVKNKWINRFLLQGQSSLIMKNFMFHINIPNPIQ